nr:hypothetical protein [Tanacetum cinerariifolium]
MSTKEHDKRHRPRRSRSSRTSVFSKIRRERSKSPIRRERSRSPRQRTKEEDVFKRLGSRGKSVSARSESYNRHSHLRYTEALSDSEDPFTPRIRYFDFPKTRMSSHIKTYDGSEDPKDHLKIFQAAAKTERWAMSTLCHMFNSTLIESARVWFDDLPPESIDSYEDLKKAFLENSLQQKKYIKDPTELQNIKQRDGESTKDFVRRYKLESKDVKGASECMRISGFVQGITNPELIKRLHDKIPKTVDEMMRVTTSFLRGEVAASNHEGKKIFQPWKQHESSQKKNFKKGDKGKFKAPPLMTTPVEKRNHAKFYDFHGEVGNNTDECMHLRKQIEEMLKAGKLSHLIKEIKQTNEKEQPKVTKKGETSGKDKAEDEGPEGPMIIEAEIRGHCVHRMCLGRGSASEIMYEHCFSRLRPEIKKQLMLATTPLIGFSSEIIWSIGQIQLLVKIEDEEHFALVWMNFMIVRSQSPYNGIIGRPGVKKLQAVPSTAHGMLKISIEGGVITLKSSKLVPLECAMVSGPTETPSVTKPIAEERFKLVINLEYPEQTVMIGSTLTEVGRNKLCGLLQHNLDIFAWKPADMIGVLRHIVEHRLNMREGCSPIRQNRTKDEIVKDVEETFKTLREINMKLNLKKCAFGVEEEMFLGYKVNAKGLKVCPDKWTTEAKEAFKQMKQLITELPMLTAPMEKEELIVYLAAIKEAILADFIVERPEEGSPDTTMEQEVELPEPWILFTNGSSCTDGSGAGLRLTNPEGMEFTYALRFRGDATNNEAEYEALIGRLRIAEQMGVKNLQANVDS